MAKLPALERHRRDEGVPVHEHAGLLHFCGWKPGDDVTAAQYRTALRAWRKAPVSGQRAPAQPKPAAKRKPAAKPKPTGGADGAE